MANPVFESLMTHTCNVVKAGISTGDYGHTTISYTSGQTTTNVPCRLMQGLFIVPFTNEQTNNIMSGTVYGDFWLHIPLDKTQATLLASGAETTHRIENVVDAISLAVIDSGPFDIQAIQKVAGELNHVKLLLRKVS